LHRIQTGHFQLIPEYSIEYLEQLNETQRDMLLLPAYAPVEYLPKVQIPEGRHKYFCNGQESNIEHPPAPEVLVFDQDHCLGLAEITDKKIGAEASFKFIGIVPHGNRSHTQLNLFCVLCRCN
jgi:tRNA pseudouridine55 synthase